MYYLGKRVLRKGSEDSGRRNGTRSPRYSCRAQKPTVKVEGQVDLVSRLVSHINHIVTLVIPIP